MGNGGNQFRVLKPIELTDEFEAEKKETAADADAEKAGEDAKKADEGKTEEKKVGPEANKEDAKPKKLLRVGDSLEVHEFPRKTSAGVLRLKGKVKRTGDIGWANVKVEGTGFFMEPF